jgi:hypothetical protein
MAFLGFHIINNKTTSVPRQNTLAAATIPYKTVTAQVLPFNTVIEEAKEIGKDTVRLVIHDTVYVNNTKYVRIPGPNHMTDTIYVLADELPEINVMSVKNRSPGDREEEPTDEDTVELTPVIILTVDGKTVYSSENEIHSGSNLRDSTSVLEGF